MNAPVQNKRVLITGGLGFIGYNAALHFARQNSVLVIDDCSRIGVAPNMEHLEKQHIEFKRVDVNSQAELKQVFNTFKPEIVIHLAAQVAVTLSIEEPFRDFQSNLLGSFHILELARHSDPRPIVLYASTNKVYGCIAEESLVREGRRYTIKDFKGFSESRLAASDSTLV